MVVHGESQRESRHRDVSQKPFYLTPKNTLRIGNWNLRTLYQVGKTANMTKNSEGTNSKSLGISEMRWTGFGQLRTTTGETVLYSGAEVEHHME